MSNSWRIANNISTEMGLDGEGLAIPVRYSDRLSGQVNFEILGVVNGSWNQIIRIHPSFWRSTSWEQESKQILAHIQYILIKDLQIEIQSNNGGIDQLQDDKDLVYQTQMNPNYISTMDDLEFNITTQLTTEEARDKGIKNTPKLNNPYVGKNALREVYNTIRQELKKPEEQYLTDYYLEYCSPQKQVETPLQGIIPWTQRFDFPDIGESWMTGYDYLLKSAKTNVRTKTIEQ